MDSNEPKIVLITGGHGFIGSHVARRLYTIGTYRIRIIDIARDSSIDGPICHEFIRGDLCEESLCQVATRGVHTVLHFAANMGGMGTIHGHNDFILYKENHSMTTNLLQACLSADVQRFFYASSACIYPDTLQRDLTGDVSLRESDAWADEPPKPQGLYGLEKLISEILLTQFASKMDIRIARFHNVFGPGGAWNDGREKAPAAMLRKAAALKLLGAKNPQFEVWGSGQQRRSFLFIDDAVAGVLKLLESSIQTPLNIGSDSAVTIQQLAEHALKHAGIDPAAAIFSYDTSKPIGVASRNSNNEKVQSLLHWSPSISLGEGMRRTESWIRTELLEFMDSSVNPCDRQVILEDMLKSKVLHLASDEIVFAILLPVTSRGSNDPNDCLSNLRHFAVSLFRTTWRDTRTGGDIRYRLIVYIAIDEDDDFLLRNDGSSNKVEEVLRDEGVYDVVSIVCNHPRGHVCKLWKDCARQAFNDGCHYMVLMGDDVELKDEGWMRDAHGEFGRLASSSGAPFGFGCVAFTDISFPGMPTFPIIHRTHMDIVQGEVIPDVFVNQDGDPFLFQLYRRWGCSKMFSSRLSNGVGGAGDARYIKQHAQDWTFDTLDAAVSQAEAWLQNQNMEIERQITLDIVIPCYRVDLSILSTILALESSACCSIMFIIIIDNPASPYAFELQAKYSHRSDVRIRINKVNLGASASRNRGMEESAADWVHFLDDDVVPHPDLLFKAEEIIRAHPNAAGFVGNALFPRADTVFTTAVHLAGVTYFWDIATKIRDDVPWGVTANLISRRNIRDGVKFSPMFPKTGGGEDIDFCRNKRDFSVTHEGEGFIAAPEVTIVHPWWNGGSRSYWRFHHWSVGDGALVKQFPQYTYADFAPNSAELLLICCLFSVAGTLFARLDILMLSLKAFAIVIFANVLHDCYRHLYQHPERNAGINSSIKGFWWVAAIVESSFIRMFSEIGRLRGMISRGEYSHFGRRFDWFTGRIGDGPMNEERINSLQRAILFGTISYLFAI